MREREPLSTVQYLEAHIIRLCAAATTAATTYGWVLDPAGEVTLIQIALSFPELTRYLPIKNKKRVRRMRSSTWVISKVDDDEIAGA